MRNRVPIQLDRQSLIPLCFLLIYACSEPKESTPNILFIMSDDHAEAAVSAYGSNLIQTPHIDRIAAEGVRLRTVLLPTPSAHRAGRYC